MRKRLLGTILGGVVLFAFMAIVYPAISGQPIWNIAWIIISAITATIAAPVAAFLTERRRRRMDEQK